MTLLAVLSPFALAIVAPWLQRRLDRAAGWLLAALPAVLFIGFLNFALRHPAESHVFSWPWIPSLQIQLSFLLDGLSLLFALMITGIGALVLIYSGGYLAGHPHLGRFYVYLLMFMGSMLGVVLSNNVLSLFVFWELTSFSSYLLIGFYHDRQASRAAALQALLVTGAGGLALLAGVILLAFAGGSWELSELLARGDLVRGHPLLHATLVLILLGAFTKSAQFPFHFWLPAAMEAPAPVSTYLHSATMVKAGVYLLARLHPILGAAPRWQLYVGGCGALTMLVGAGLALLQVDIKRQLAYTTVSVLGALTFLLGLGGETAVTGAILYILVHSLYKGALFLVGGNVDHAVDSRDVTRLRGLRRAMPITFVAALLAGLSMAGLPPFVGFISKELIYEALHAHDLSLLLAVVAVAANGFMFVVALLIGVRIFVGPPAATPREPHEAPPSMWIGPLVLASLGLIFGLVPGLIEGRLVAPAVAAVGQLPATPAPHLALWHGFTPMLLLSAVTIAAGLLVFLGWDFLRARLNRLAPLGRLGPARWYEWVLQGVLGFAHLQTRILQSGSLPVYIATLIVVIILLVGGTLLEQVQIVRLANWNDIRFHELCIILTMMMAILTLVTTNSRLTAIAALGVVGYCVSLIFVLFGAPDLAITQFCIETLSVVLFVLVLYKLPRFQVFSRWPTRLAEAAIAVAFGLVVIGLMTLGMESDLGSPISEFYAANSYLQAHGRNIVNVILVDFRGVDTMGEITVLAIGALGVLALLKLRLDRDRPGKESS